MKKFFVSKSDKSRVAFIKRSIDKIRPDCVYVICDGSRQDVYSEINAINLPLKELNKAENWIAFVQNFSENSLLVIDQVLKFIFYGDGKKNYLKSMSQGMRNVIVTDVVPFYTEPHEIFYPFWFLGKEILGYSNYNSFKANHIEERKDGHLFLAHSFEVLKEKISEYYVQDYDNFFSNVCFHEFKMTTEEAILYENSKAEFSQNFTSPIKLYSDVSESINLIPSRYRAAKEALKGMNNFVVVNNSASYTKRHQAHLGRYPFLTFTSELKLFQQFQQCLLLQLPVINPFRIFYILSLDLSFIQVRLIGNKLEDYFFNKIYNNELRQQFDTLFYNENL